MTLQEIVKKEYVENDSTLCFKTTPVVKVFILSLLTGGIYDVILCYNYWKSLKENFGYKVSPFWRGLFNEFTNFKLIPIFVKYFKNFNIKFFGAYLLAGLYFIFSYTNYKISFKSAMLENTDWTLEIISFVLGLFTASIFAYIQSRINKVNELYFTEAQKNPWRISNTIWTIVFLVFLVLAYLPE